MSSRRPVILMAILLALIGAYLALPALREQFAGAPQAQAPSPRDEAILAGTNSVSNLVVTQQPDGRWMASFDYFYTGAPRDAMVRVFQVVTGGAGGVAPINWQVGGRSAQRGAHRHTVEVFNPNVHEMYTTTQVYAVIDVAPAPPMAKVAVDQRIQWPDPVLVEVQQALANGKADAIVQKAVQLIDSGQSHELQKARALLQALVDKSPRTDSAYVELARVAMKTNWGPSGLHEAESLIGSALQISPDSANAKVLLGYVYAHQQRYREAEKLFAQAAAANPPNLWLWANWGELLAMQGRTEAAIQKYREATTRPPTKDTYDRARFDAYGNLLRLLGQRGDLNAMEALLKQRSEEYPAMGCFSVDHARFLVLQRGDADAALAVLRDSPSPRCDAATARTVQGLARYVAWSRTEQGAARAESLLQARAFLPVGPSLFYQLASTESSAKVAQQLVAAGEKIGLQDNRQMDALAYALSNGDTATARRLLRLGAQPMAEVGPEQMPAALIPVLTRDLESIRMLQRAGVDYTKLRYRGSTALDHARERDDDKLLHALDPRSGRL
jgi:tetratricopeptide (TPR) repeat protein